MLVEPSSATFQVYSCLSLQHLPLRFDFLNSDPLHHCQFLNNYCRHWFYLRCARPYLPLAISGYRIARSSLSSLSQSGGVVKVAQLSSPTVCSCLLRLAGKWGQTSKYAWVVTFFSIFNFSYLSWKVYLPKSSGLGVECRSWRLALKKTADTAMNLFLGYTSALKLVENVAWLLVFLSFTNHVDHSGCI